MRLKLTFLILLSFLMSFQINAKEINAIKGKSTPELLARNANESSEKSSNPDGYNGLHGYIGFGSGSVPTDYNMGMGFYASVWSLVSKPLSGFQIGLPSSWIIPDNRDNNITPLCPVGTYARDNWPERGPTWDSVFQTVEGGLGYWAGNRFRYGPPKFSMNGTSQCYDYQIASPGWPFFGSSSPLPDNELGVAQLSNRLLIPPDGLTFSGEQNGAMFGYSWMALPLMEAKTGEMPTGEHSWTCFINATNFKGPIAYYVAETWSRVAYLFDYPFDYGRGLDSKPGHMGGGAMEINTVPYFKATDSSGTVYTKIPQLQFPVDSYGQSYLVSDVTYYAKSALYNAVENWRDSGQAASGTFAESGKWNPTLYTYNISYSQEGVTLSGINDIMSTEVYDTYTWGLKWSENPGYFPQYFKQVGGNRVPVSANDVPAETGLLSKTFPEASAGGAYEATIAGAWAQPGPASQEYYTHLADGTKVTYRWYRFVDQPTFQQYNWTDAEKQQLQSLVEKIHTYWGIDQEYMTPPSKGTLATLDSGLIVTPPSGYEVGYVPIVIGQEYAPNEGGCTKPVVTVTDTSSNSISLFWNNAGADSHTVYYQAENSNWELATTGISGTNYVLTGLSDNTSYSVAVLSICSDGTNPYQIVTAKTGDDASECSAPKTTVTATTESKLSLSWNDTGANSYTLFYRTLTDNWQNIPGLTETTYTLTGLSSNTSYNIAVVAKCPDGSNLYEIITAATDDSDVGGLKIEDVLGKYVREPPTNGWHTGTISAADDSLQWTNEAGKTWTLIPDLENGQLQTTDDCPYPGENFTIVVEYNSDGSTTVTGFMFLNELYSR